MGDFDFGKERKIEYAPIAHEDRHFIVFTAEAASFERDIIGDDEIQVLFVELAPGMGDEVVGLRRESHQKWRAAIAATRTRVGQNVYGRFQLDAWHPFVLLD